MKKILLILLLVFTFQGNLFSQFDQGFDWFSSNKKSAKVYDTLHARKDTVWVQGTDTVVTGAANLGVFPEFLSVCNGLRAYQSGYIYGCKVYCTKSGTITSFRFKWYVVNKITHMFDSVAGTGNILASLTSGTANYVSFPAVYVPEGAYYSIVIDNSSAVNLFGSTSIPGTQATLLYSQFPTGAHYDFWTNATRLDGYHIPVVFDGQASVSGWESDSKIAGYPWHSTFRELDSSRSALTLSVPWLVDSAMGWNGQNVAIRGEYIGNGTDRQTADLTLKHFKITFNEYDVNDVNVGRPTKDIRSYDSLWMSRVVADGSIPVELGVIGWTNGTDAQMQKLDTVNWNKQDLMAKYFPTAIYMDCRPVLCKFRPSGPLGNLYDIIAAFDYDGVHLMPAGYRAWAMDIVRQLRLIFR